MRKRKEILTLERLKAVLLYDPETGVWTWIAKPSPKATVKVGSVAGAVQINSITIELDGVRYRANRLAWFYMTGGWPDPECDHRDTDWKNNKWANLRLATRQQNGANRRISKNNTSGWKGVSWNAKQECWVAGIQVLGKSTYLGSYDCGPAAHFAYLVAADKAFGEFARGG